MKFITLTLITFTLFACGKKETKNDQKFNSTQMIQSSKVKLNQENLPLRNLILHRVFQKNYEPFNKDELAKLTSALNQNYLNLFPVLIKSNKENFELYVLPKNTDVNFINESILNTLSTNRIFFQENFNIGGYTIVADYEDEEIIINEQNFQEKQIEFKNFSEINLINLNKFQKVSFLEFKKEIYLPRFIKVKKSKLQNGKCSDGEFTRSCRCEYEIELPSNQYELVQQDSIEANYGTFKFESAEVKRKLVDGRPINNECFKTPQEEILIKPIWSYSGKVLVKGDLAREVVIDSSLQISL